MTSHQPSAERPATPARQAGANGSAAPAHRPAPPAGGTPSGQETSAGRETPAGQETPAGRRLPGPLRRSAAAAGHVALLAALGLVAAALLTAVPRLINDVADGNLRTHISRFEYQVRDLTIEARPALNGPTDSEDGVAELPVLRSKLPAPVAGLIGQEWYAAGFDAEEVIATGNFVPFTPGSPRQLTGLRTVTGLTEAVRLVAGNPPASVDAPGGRTIEVMVARRVADTLSLRPGAQLRLTRGTAGVLEVTVVGVFEPVDPAAPFWADMPLALEALEPINDGDPYRSILLTDWAGVDTAADTLNRLETSWRYRVDESRLDTSLIGPTVEAVVQGERTLRTSGVTVLTSLDSTLLAFEGQLRSIRALLAVVQAGLLAGLLGLVLLAAVLAVERRRTELALLRARGASIAEIGRRTLVEALMVQPLAVLAGWLLGRLVPGRAGAAEWLVPLVAGVTVGAVPVLAVLTQRRLSFVARRTELVQRRWSPRRLTAELTVLFLAGLGVFLLQRRGLSQSSGVDPYLVSVPVLLAVGAALLVLRLLPWPLRQLGRLAARTRGPVLFLGLARAGRGAPVGVGPLAVLVLAVTTGIFSGVLAGTVTQARDRATDRAVPADARLTGYAFAPDTTRRLADVPGVTAVAPLLLESNRAMLADTTPGARSHGQVQVLVVDAATFAEVLARSGRPDRLPADFLAATRSDAPVPAIVSPEVAETVGATAVADVQGRFYGFRPTTVSADFPGVEPGTRRFVVLPWQALPVPEWKPVIPNRFHLAGHGYDPDVVRRIADDGQREHRAAVLGRPVERAPLAAELLTWEQYRVNLDRSGANGVLSLVFLAGAVGGGALVLLAVGFAVVADARTRGQVLSRLRTMGLSRRQGRQLLVYELVPLVTTAVAAGCLVGLALPKVLAPALGLSTFTAGVPAPIHLDPWLIAGLLLTALAGLTAALALENLLNRRMRLGTVLRLGEES